MSFAVAALLGNAAMAADASRTSAPPWIDLADAVFRPLLPTDPGFPLLADMFAEDATGFLWVGGSDGLGRWDGYRFHLYTADHPQSDGLRDHFVRAMHLDRSGQLWVGTSAGGLARYDAERDRFVSVPLQFGTVTARDVWSITDDDGGLWVGTGSGLFRLDKAGRLVARLHHDPHDPGSLPNDRVVAVLRDRHGVLWVGGAAGLAQASGQAMRFTAVGLRVTGSGTPDVTRLMEDHDGSIWIGTREVGAFVIGADRDTARPIPASGRLPGQDAAPEVTGFTEVAPGEIWIGTSAQGILQVDAATLATRRIRHDPEVPNSLDSDQIEALYRDRSGLVWVGTLLGLSKLDPTAAGVFTLYGAADGKSLLTIQDATAVLARPDGSLWLGSQGDGIQILDASGRKAGAVSVQRVFCLAASADGPVFVGTRDGLYLADADGKSIRRLDVPGRASTATVLAMSVVDGSLWLGGADDGLWELRLGADRRLTVLRHEDASQLTSAEIRVIAPGPGHTLAVGTQDGFNLLDRDTGKIERIVADTENAQSPPAGVVASFVVDRSGRLWVGTNNVGIDVLVGRDAAGRPHFHHIGMAQGLPNADINTMLMDNQGRIWASTDHGLAEIDPVTFAVRALQAADGVAISTYWAEAGDRTIQGDLVFGGVGGITVVQPSRVVRWRYQPPVVVTELRIGGHIVQVGPTGLPADRSVPEGAVPTLQISPQANSLAVEFSALDYSAPSHNHYRYRLDGFDHDWIVTDPAHRVASYTNLPPGHYLLELQGSNREGVWTDPALTLRVHVAPAWFQTVGFRLAQVVAAILLVAALVQSRTIILRRGQRELEDQVRARTAELFETQQQLRHLVFVDALSQLPNRRAFDAELGRLFDAASDTSFALLLIDLDGFKRVNDSFGHAAGDGVLAIVAERLRNALRSGDFAARLGGDEFAILLPKTRDRDSIDMICERIVSTMSATMSVNAISVSIGASVGVALSAEHGDTPDSLYRNADVALYDAKRAGGASWRWFASESGSGA